MPTVLRYDPSLSGVAEGYLRSGQAITAAEQDRFERQFGENARQFDQGLSLQADVQGLEDRLNRSGLAQNAFQGDQQFAIQQAGLGLEAQRNDNFARQQELQAQAEAEQQARLRFGQFAGIAKQREQQQFEVALSSQAAIMDARDKGSIDDDQLQEGIAQWEQTYGMPWAFPQQMAQEQQQAQQQQQIQALSQGFVDPITGQPLASQEQIQTWLDGGMEIKDIAAMQVKLTAEARNRAKLNADLTVGEREAEAREVEFEQTFRQRQTDIDADNVARDTKHQADQRNAALGLQTKYLDMVAKGEQNYLKAMTTWEESKLMPADAEGVKPTPGPRPNIDNYVPHWLREAAQSKPGGGDAPEWYKRLKPGEQYRHPDGTLRTKR